VTSARPIKRGDAASPPAMTNLRALADTDHVNVGGAMGIEDPQGVLINRESDASTAPVELDEVPAWPPLKMLDGQPRPDDEDLIAYQTQSPGGLGRRVLVSGLLAGLTGQDGDVIGPESSTLDNLATFGDITGKRITDSTVALSNVARKSLTLDQFADVTQTGTLEIAATSVLEGVNRGDEVRAKRVMQWLKDVGAATFTVQGIPAPTIDGAGAGSPASGDDSSGPWLTTITATATNSEGGLYFDYARCRTDWNPEMVQTVKQGTNVTSIRYWVGLFSAAPGAVSDLTTIHGAAFVYDSAVHGTAFWRCVTGNASAQTETTTSVAINSGNVDLLWIRVTGNGTSVEFWIDGVLVATHTTNLPTTTQLMGPAARVTTLASPSGSKRLSLGRGALLHY